MMAKIEWYEEVLALDPGSRLFLPFARCLVEQGMRDRAVEVLRAGLAVHPEHMEARILLIHLLAEGGDDAASCAESQQVAEMLMTYPGFWKSLGMVAGQTHGADVALCLQFVSAMLRDPSLTLAGMVARGLGLLCEGGEAPEAACRTSGGEVPVLPARAGQTPDTARFQSPSEVSGAVTEESSARHEQTADSPAVVVSVPQTDSSVQFVSERVETEENVNLRTRSMAQILAEQGDLDGALVIYEELAVQDPDNVELRRKIGELRRQKTDGGDRSRYGGSDTEGAVASLRAFSEAPTQDTQGSEQGNKSVVALLEHLADRLEARAGA